LFWSATKLTSLTNGKNYILPSGQLSTKSLNYRQVTLEEATAKATQMGIMFMETSAKAGHNVKSLFKKIAMSLPGMEKDNQGDANTSTAYVAHLTERN